MRCLMASTVSVEKSADALTVAPWKENCLLLLAV